MAKQKAMVHNTIEIIKSALSMHRLLLTLSTYH